MTDVLVPEVVHKPQLKALQGYNDETGTWEAESIVGRFFAALMTGCSQQSAAAFAGTTHESTRRWRNMGQSQDPGDDGDRIDIPLAARVYVDFARKMNEVLGRREVELANIVRTGCKDNPALALTVLGRMYPHWRESRVLEVDMGEILTQDRAAQLLKAHPSLAASAETFALALAAADAELYDEAIEGGPVTETERVAEE